MSMIGYNEYCTNSSHLTGPCVPTGWSLLRECGIWNKKETETSAQALALGTHKANLSKIYLKTFFVFCIYFYNTTYALGMGELWIFFKRLHCPSFAKQGFKPSARVVIKMKGIKISCSINIRYLLVSLTVRNLET